MPSLMSMEELFYGPSEATWILPTREDEGPLRRYKPRDLSPPRRFMRPEPQPELRPLARYDPRYSMERELRPVARPAPAPREIRPIERLARVHTVPQPVPVTEEIRKVVEAPVPAPVAPPTQVVVAPPPPPVIQRSVSPPRPIIHHPIELKVPMCCEKCARKVRERLEELEGVESVVADQYNQKVVVYGHVDPERVLNRVRLVKKRSAFWDMTVDYSDRYRRARQAQAEVVARENAKRAQVAKEQDAAAKAKALVAPVHNPPQVVVNLPQDHHGPKVTAILPPENNRPLPYVHHVEPAARHHRFVGPPRAYR